MLDAQSLVEDIKIFISQLISLFLSSDRVGPEVNDEPLCLSLSQQHKSKVLKTNTTAVTVGVCVLRRRVVKKIKLSLPVLHEDEKCVTSGVY